jgi:hypothetical protein
MNRRQVLLAMTALLPLPLAACPGTTTAPPLATDLQLFENALAAIEAALPTGSPLIATIEADIATVEAEITAGASSPSATTASLLESIASAVLGLFPGGGTIVTIANAILSLLSGLGVALARPHILTMTAADARAYLRTLPMRRRA